MDAGVIKLQRSGRDGTLKTFVICTACQCYCGDHIKKNKVCGYVEIMGLGYIQVLVGKLEGKEKLKVQGFNERIVV